jgi:hypothetical protein
MKQPRRGRLRRWWMRKRREKLGSEATMRKLLQTAEARGRDDGCGGRRRRISWRRFSSSSAGAGAGAREEGQQLILQSEDN